ncbi:von Willebrand factor type A domain protein [Thioalkalivibrio nitratireducens DSM 14787]|uniref:von Willebrand factor type A domain protein n=1 Tax=Thioalkalivibrio nitratireducens (strain DSM 14787 / UNIQEM 213 / ALEN2) TaxID=1255043 RepID=L0DZJ6_THIND|nr:VWA domain-containing protein [Thioalkalivibrio nitratireducens]AGA33816.1 von Willebrand factor type A domain protein [Thioalkalivibrio nitratireducens DSM 14787]
MRSLSRPFATLLAVALFGTGAATAADRATVMVFDASGSMWNRIDGDITRIEVARDVMEEFFAGRDAGAPISVIAYGHRRRGDCADIEVLAPLGVHDPGELTALMRALNPRGMTPLTDSLELARTQIPRTAESADIILVTDGLENCGGDPCALAAQLAAEGIPIRAHVVGFGMTSAEVNSLSCVPEQTGGQLFHTSSGVELAEALAAVSMPQAVELVFRAVDARTEEPLGPSDWQIFDAQTGARVAAADATASFTAALEDGRYRIAVRHPGYEGALELAVDETLSGVVDIPLQRMLATVTLEGVDARTGVAVPDVQWTWTDLASEAAQTGRGAGERHRILVTPGDYRIEGNAGAMSGGSTIAATLEQDVTARVELAEALPEASVSAPGEVTSGERFPVEWTGPDDRSDYIAIVEAGAPDATHISYARTRFGSPAQVTAPDALGAYEVRYVHHGSGRTLASQAVTLVAASAGLQAPDEAVAGAAIEVAWEGPDNPGDYIAVVEAGAPEGTSISYARTRFGSPARVTLPDALGTYELRYVINQSGRTLASRAITLVAASAGLQAPDEAVAGAAIEVAWEGPDNPGDYIAVVEAGAPEGTSISYARTRFGSPARVTLPDALGTYELRYVINQSGRTLASRPITLVAASASLEGPEVIVPGGQIEVVWEGPDNPGDYITIVELGAGEGSRGDYWRTSRGTPARLRAPEAEGDYELRYVIQQSRRTLAALPVTVGAGDVSLAVEGDVQAGGVMTVAWQGPGRFEDFIQVVNEGAADDVPALREARASQGNPVQLFAPAAPGRYEVRYRASDSGEVLARTPLVVAE